MRGKILAALAVSLLMAGCKPAVRTPEPSPYPTGAWTFHALDGEVGQGPLLRFEGGAFWLEGCGSAAGTIVSPADSQFLLVGEAGACGEKQHVVQTQLLALLTATPQMASTAKGVCDGSRGLEIRAKGQRAVFCELEPYHPE